jgi:hypothetical protein
MKDYSSWLGGCLKERPAPATFLSLSFEEVHPVLPEITSVDQNFPAYDTSLWYTLLPTILMQKELYTPTLTLLIHIDITFISGSFQIKEDSL